MADRTSRVWRRCSTPGSPTTPTRPTPTTPGRCCSSTTAWSPSTCTGARTGRCGRWSRCCRHTCRTTGGRPRRTDSASGCSTWRPACSTPRWWAGRWTRPGCGTPRCGTGSPGCTPHCASPGRRFSPSPGWRWCPTASTNTSPTVHTRRRCRTPAWRTGSASCSTRPSRWTVAGGRRARLGHSPAYLVRAFTREYGLPPHRYLAGRRVDLARRLLLDGQPPASVATEAGFHDQSHLTRHFTRMLGTTPRRFATGA